MSCNEKKNELGFSFSETWFLRNSESKFPDLCQTESFSNDISSSTAGNIIVKHVGSKIINLE